MAACFNPQVTMSTSDKLSEDAGSKQGHMYGSSAICDFCLALSSLPKHTRTRPNEDYECETEEYRLSVLADICRNLNFDQPGSHKRYGRPKSK
jgi:hypothetical protein